MQYLMKRKRLWIYKAVFLICISCLCLFAFAFRGERVQAKADAGDVIAVNSYDVVADIGKDRKVKITETFNITFLDGSLSMFYRSLPIEQARYFDITASCNGNADFSYYVADNPDVSGFLDINCVGGVRKNQTWTYVISYTMENGANAATRDDGMTIDVVSFGASVPMHNVSVTVHFPFATDLQHCKSYVGNNSQTPTDLHPTLSNGGKTLQFSVNKLSVSYQVGYGFLADGITLDFTMTGGTFDSYASTRLFTDGLVWILLCGAAAIAATIALRYFFRKKGEVIAVVNVKPPKNTDPLKMGKTLDGVVDSEDITSMIYYFAHHGYLEIDFSDEDDPVFRKKKNLPEDAPVYQKTLFYGLFDEDDDEAEVAVSDLKEHYYIAVDSAKRQVPHVKMYDKKSVAAYVAGGVIALLYTFLVGVWLSSNRIGGGYMDFSGIAFVIPIVCVLGVHVLAEGYRFKWKKSALVVARIVQIAVMAVFAIVYVSFFSNHVLTEYEKWILVAVVCAVLVIDLPVLSRRADYLQKLGDIVGFKEFIVVTEADKIKFMLQENPQLYYEILPYAQVLGVTKEWENKFADIVIEPPTWGCGAGIDLFDYMWINRCLRAAMYTAIAPPEHKGGSYVGGAGSGGSFGGFGGGGFGGGGFGAR